MDVLPLKFLLGSISLNLYRQKITMDKTLLEILACPVCKGELQYDQDNQELICRFDRLAYPIINDIPVMLESRARRLGVEEES